MDSQTQQRSKFLMRRADAAIATIETDSSHFEGAIAKGYKLYYRKLPDADYKIDEYGNQTTEAEGSRYVAPVVHDAIEAVSAAAVDAFASSRRPVEYTPSLPELQEANDFARQTFWEDNDGTSLIRDIFQVAGIAKMGIGRVVWDNSYEYVDKSNILNDEEISILEQQPGITIKSTEVTGEGQVVEYTERQKRRKICIDQIDPELFGMEGRGLGDGEWTFCYHQEYWLESELLDLYPEMEDQIRRLPVSTHKRSNNIQFARDSLDGARDSRREGRFLSEVFPERIVTHAFLRERDEAGHLRIYYLMYGKGSQVLFELEEVDDHFYFWAEPFPVAGRSRGQSIAEVMEPNQNAQTKVIREILNNIELSNHDRTEVNLAMIDPADRDKVKQVSERLGGTYAVRGPDAIRQIPRLPLPTETLSALQILQDDQESRLGYSKTAQGMNPDVIANQNSETMVDKYVAIGSKRIAAIINQTAETFMQRCYRLIYDIAVQHGEELDGSRVEVDGYVRPITPSRWPPKCRISKRPVLTIEERKSRANDLLTWNMTMLTLGTQNPSVNVMYQPENMAFVLREAADLMDMSVDQVLTLPGTPTYEQKKAELEQVQQTEKQRLEAEVAEKQQAVQNARMATEANIAAETQKTLAQIDDLMAKQNLSEEAHDHKVFVDLRKLQLEKEELELEEKLGKKVSTAR
jgi:hypothetical protein